MICNALILPQLALMKFNSIECMLSQCLINHNANLQRSHLHRPNLKQQQGSLNNVLTRKCMKGMKAQQHLPQHILFNTNTMESTRTCFVVLRPEKPAGEQWRRPKFTVGIKLYMRNIHCPLQPEGPHTVRNSFHPGHWLFNTLPLRNSTCITRLWDSFRSCRQTVWPLVTLIPPLL